ncbi:hypothetical protein B0T12DRAFT_394418 [Alternaria alternata]|nr:hypothetical protein B0T12DRAFT_394418 [Alternaria alternata]
MIGSSALEPGKMSRRKVPRQVRDGASRGVIFAASRHRVCDRGEGSQWVDKPDAAGPGSRPRVCVCSAGLDAGDGHGWIGWVNAVSACTVPQHRDRAREKCRGQVLASLASTVSPSRLRMLAGYSRGWEQAASHMRQRSVSPGSTPLQRLTEGPCPVHTKLFSSRWAVGSSIGM